MTFKLITRLYFNRHGHKEGGNLSNLGIEEAQEIGMEIEQYRQDVGAKLTRVLSASKPRVQETAKHSKAQIVGGEKLPVEVRKFLGEAIIPKRINDEIIERTKSADEEKAVQDFLEGKFINGGPKDVALPLLKKLNQYMNFLKSWESSSSQVEFGLITNQQVIIESLMIELLGENSKASKICKKPLQFAEGGLFEFGRDDQGKVNMVMHFRDIHRAFTQEEIEKIYLNLKAQK